MTSKVHILLPVHNRREITKKFIDCLAAQSYTNYHLVLIDDGSTDGTSEMVSARVGNLTVIRGTGDWWWAGSLQQGINRLAQQGVSDHDIVMFANDDITFEANFLEIAVTLLNEIDGMLLPQVFDEALGLTVESGVEADLKGLMFKKATSPDRINCLPTRGLLMKMAVVRRVGDFYPKLLPHYLSDYEYTIRASKKGISLATSSRLLIQFDETTTGFRVFDNLSLGDFFAKYFSKKSVSNPLYWTAFILLTVPALYAPWNIMRVWLSAAKLILKRL